MCDLAPQSWTNSPRANAALSKVFDFLLSKSLTDTCMTLRHELDARSPATEANGLDQYTSELEKLLDQATPMSDNSTDGSSVVQVPASSTLAPEEMWHWRVQGNARDLLQQDVLELFEPLRMSEVKELPMRQRRGRGTPQSNACFHDTLSMSEEQKK